MGIEQFQNFSSTYHPEKDATGATCWQCITDSNYIL